MNISRKARLDGKEPMSEVEERVLIERAQKGNERALETLLRFNLPLVFRHSTRVAAGTHEDRILNGMVGLYIAIMRFKPDMGCRLCTYALNWINREMRRECDKDRAIYIPTAALDKLYRIVKIRSMYHAGGKEFTEETAYQETGYTQTSIRDVMRHIPAPISLDAPMVYGYHTRSYHDTGILRIQENDGEQEVSDALDFLKKANLTEREKYIFLERVYKERTLEELGEEMNLTRERVRQIEGIASRKIKHAREKQGER